MSIPFLSNVDLGKNQILNRVIQILASAPASPVEGQEYYDSTNHGAYVYNGTSWQPVDAALKGANSIPISTLVTNPLARANHTGTQTASTISDLATVVQAYTLNQFAAPTANVAMGGFTLTGLNTSPSAAGQAAEYSWVVSQIQASAAGIDSKPSVCVTTSANQALTGLPTIDGITLVANDRILLTGQTTASQNGPWVVASGAWTRPTGETVTPQAFWFVEQGTVGAGTQWKVSTTGTITLNTTSLSIVQFGASNTYTAGNGLTGTTTFSILLDTNPGLSVSGTGIKIALQTTSGLVLDASGLAVQAVASGGISVVAGGLQVDATIVAKKFTQTIGNGALTSIAVTHNLNDSTPQVTVTNVATGQQVLVDWVATSANVVTLTFAVAPTSNQYSVSVVG